MQGTAQAYTVTEPDDEDDFDLPMPGPLARAVAARSATTPNQVEQRSAENEHVSKSLANVMMGVRFMLGAGKAASEAGFAIAKGATHVGLEVARNIVDGVGEATGLDATGVTPLISGTLAFAEFCAILGIETGRFWTNFGFSTAGTSVRALNNVFGSTEMATAIKEFSALVRREISAEAGQHGISLKDIGTVDSIRALMAWVCLQSSTSALWLSDRTSNSKRMTFGGAGVAEEEPEDVDWSNLAAGGSVDPGDVVKGSIGTPSEHNVVGFPISAADSSSPRTPQSDTQLLIDLRRYVKFATGMYGRHQISAMNGELPKFGFTSNPDPRHTGNKEHHFFAEHADTPLESIYHTTTDDDGFEGILSSQRYKPTVYVIVDHSSSQVILAFRGTNSLEDLMVDLTCEHEDYKYEDAGSFHVHSGMLRAARAVATANQPTRVWEAVVSLLKQNTGYGLLLTGHSLGAGLATCLTLLWTDPSTGTTHAGTGLPVGRPVRCFAYAAPAVVSASLGALCRPFITSVLVGSDLVPRLSLGSVRDLARVVAQLHTSPAIRDDLINRIAFGRGDQEGRDRDVQLRREIEGQCLLSDKLVPPGRTFWIVEGKEEDPNVTSSDPLRMYDVLDPAKTFDQLLFSSTMARDHMPHVYSSLLHKLA